MFEDKDRGRFIKNIVKMKKIAIYTAIFWDYDTIKRQPKQTIDCDFYCFTDTKQIKIQSNQEIDRKIIPCKKRNMHPRMNAKRYRTHPSEILKDYDVFVYMDGTAMLKSADTVEKLLKKLWTDDMLCFKHPERETIMQEAKFTSSLTEKKYLWLQDKIIKQALHYYDNGFADQYWLSATWLIVSKNTKKNAEMLEDRRQENKIRTYQDQISFDYCCRKHKIKRGWITEHQRNNEFVCFNYPHNKDQ